MKAEDTFQSRHPLIALAIPSVIASTYFALCLASIRIPPLIGVIPELPQIGIFTAYPALFIWRIIQIIKCQQTKPMTALLVFLAAIESAGLFVILFMISFIALIGVPINPG